MSLLEFTGERFIPGIHGEIVYEHWHRYVFASRFVTDKRTLDVACGEGYGSALLANTAARVTGIDISAEAIAHAKATYQTRDNLNFVQGSAVKLPLPDGSMDIIVSFETIEHLPQEAQQSMIAEFARVLTPQGLLIISSPNRPEYAQPGAPNPFHVHELDRDELAALLTPRFPTQAWWAQRLYFASALWREDGVRQDQVDAEAWEALADDSMAPTAPPKAKYFVVLAARDEQALLPKTTQLSLFSDAEEKELQRFYHEAREVLRLDALARKQMDAMDRLTNDFCALERQTAQLHEEINEKKTIIMQLQSALNYRNSWRGWLRYPLSKLRQHFCKLERK
ncbi:MAG: class I SAM-dependent methyltransferase [Burkholderiales bacterium]|jgi:ubiquinone/menaquinone biosynthesis C-methylase UbiE|nr:class I SAM-dependent methyltransferase [Burkholderiales bacterium]